MGAYSPHFSFRSNRNFLYSKLATEQLQLFFVGKF